jgi:hypothetical protein
VEICFLQQYLEKYKEVSLQSMTAKKEQALSITFSQSVWYIFSLLREMLASGPLSGLSFTTAHQPNARLPAIVVRNFIYMSMCI